MGSGGKIDVYLDCNSPWSYLTLLKLRKERPALLAHGVEIEAHPVFLGGINVGSGNKPPWTLPAKAKLGQYEMPRGLKYFDAPEISAPGFFPIMSLLPMRAMLYTKSAHPYSQYESAFLDLWVYLWQLHKDISKPDILAECLARHFKDSEVKEIVKAAQDPEWKGKLNEQTRMCVEKGAFGAPWWFVTNREGREEPFFGSDRFHFIYQFLGVPFRDIEILPPGGESKL